MARIEQTSVGENGSKDGLRAAQTELRQMTDTVGALRDSLEQLRLEKDRSIQAVTAEANSENQHLKTTIGELRDGCESRMAVMSAAWFVEFRQRLPWLLHVD